VGLYESDVTRANTNVCRDAAGGRDERGNIEQNLLWAEIYKIPPDDKPDAHAYVGQRDRLKPYAALPEIPENIFSRQDSPVSPHEHIVVRVELRQASKSACSVLTSKVLSWLSRHAKTTSSRERPRTYFRAHPFRKSRAY
jgi:hypothetical protein